MSTTKLSPEAAALVDEYGQFVSRPTAAKIASCSVRTLNRIIAAGDLPLYRVGRTRTLRIKTTDVAALLVRVA